MACIAVVDGAREVVQQAVPILLVAVGGYSIAGRGGDVAGGGRGEVPGEVPIGPEAAAAAVANYLEEADHPIAVAGEGIRSRLVEEGHRMGFDAVEVRTTFADEVSGCFG